LIDLTSSLDAAQALLGNGFLARSSVGAVKPASLQRFPTTGKPVSVGHEIG
jgi:hypothetical protein